ncbi:MAG: adenylosuccinate lyase [Bacteroidetes bacterium]|nr:adenylosuccinate lyase [Bacteroidota bacterium]
MEFPALQAVSPIDGRYRKITSPLANYFSESSIIRYRLLVEIEYFIALVEAGIPPADQFPSEKIQVIRLIYKDFREEYAIETKAFEKQTNHDVKAVEYFLRNKWDELGTGDFKEFIHFGLTSQDINNTAFPLATKEAFLQVLYPNYLAISHQIRRMAYEWKDIPMLARTHGQPASPTSLGKEMMVFHERIENQLNLMQHIPFSAKFGGATGNLNAHYAAYPTVDWISFCNHFVNETLGLIRQQNTTQIEHYDDLGAFFDACKRINTILTDFARDAWTYISLEYFKQKVVEEEVGSSAMPHKVNPIDFENAEGNLGIANALFEHLSAKLPISRLQRDLTDSTVIRNIGVPFGHTLIAIQSLLKGIGKLMLNQEKIRADLEDNWAVVAEAIQTILRRERYPEPFKALKALTRGHSGITRETIMQFIDSLNINEEVKQELRNITPLNYTGRISF